MDSNEIGTGGLHYPVPSGDVQGQNREISWNDLVDIEPRLKDLLNKAQSVDGSDPHFCANWVWYHGGLKNRLLQLVGEEADNPDDRIRTRAAYDVAYKMVYSALPDCRDCMCS